VSSRDCDSLGETTVFQKIENTKNQKLFRNIEFYGSKTARMKKKKILFEREDVHRSNTLLPLFLCVDWFFRFIMGNLKNKNTENHILFLLKLSFTAIQNRYLFIFGLYFLTLSKISNKG
jgi:hypothetical protein